MLGKSNVDEILLDLLKCFVRTGTTEKRQKLVNVMIPKFYSAMTWHWLRIKKSRRTHKGVLTVLMDDADLGAVMSCDGQVAPQVTRLLTTSSFA